MGNVRRKSLACKQAQPVGDAHVMADPPTRKGYASSESSSRLRKARKIEKILRARTSFPGRRLLDIGTGRGLMAAHFQSLGCAVTASDRTNILAPGLDFPFAQTSGTELPFSDHSFDIVLYNHVIEHVGERADQLMHLREIRRVMAKGSILYLAVPNRWALLEPHYQMAFLSWLPERIASAYLRMRRKGSWYDCRPFSSRGIRDMMKRSGFVPEDVTLDLLYITLDDELRHRPLLHRMKHIPQPLWSLAMPIMPTFAYVATTC